MRERALGRRGRGAASNRVGRFEAWTRVEEDDGWGNLDVQVEGPATVPIPDRSRSVISRNDSPDVPFDRSINPYRGCEHGCVYCYARPTHAFLGYSPGLDFETRILFKPDAARLLREELGRPGYRCAELALGANTDPYQPLERRLRITRAVLEVLLEHRHPVAIVTKSSLVERDLDLLGALAREALVQVRISVTTLSRELARRMEPRAAAPERRLQTIGNLAAAGVPVGVLVAPLIPMLNDPELEDVLAAAREAGATSAGYVFLRLPLEVAGLFAEWLDLHYPLQAERVLERVREARGGRPYDSRFGLRMSGSGEYARVIAARFELCRRRLGYADPAPLRTDAFRVAGQQLALF
jgi:DNA repair photolyase